MATQYAVSADGARIAYDVTGSGPALVLLHGSGQTRRAWHEAGWVRRWQDAWRVIAIDLRGSGESDFVTDRSQHAIDRLCADVAAVADACQVERLALCGYSFGGAVAGYIAERMARLTALAVIGSPVLGHSLDEDSARFVEQFMAKYASLVAAYEAGTLSESERADVVKRGIPVWVARFQALASWPDVDPAAIRCPVQIVVGSASEPIYARIVANHQAYADAGFQIEVVQGLTHPQEFTEMDRVFPVVEGFMQANGRAEPAQ